MTRNRNYSARAIMPQKEEDFLEEKLSVRDVSKVSSYNRSNLQTNAI